MVWAGVVLLACTAAFLVMAERALGLDAEPASEADCDPPPPASARA